MSFFLVGKGPDGQLALLSATPVANKREALAELARITADPSFSGWEDEVFVVDLEQATPVLLVRPNAAALPDDLDALVAALGDEEPAGSDAFAVEAPGQSVIEPAEIAPIEPAWAEAVVETALAEGVSLSDALVAAAAEHASDRPQPQEPAAADADSEADGVASAPAPVNPIDELYGTEELDAADAEDEDETPFIVELAQPQAPADPVEEPIEDVPVETVAPAIPLPTPVVVEPSWPWSDDSQAQEPDETPAEGVDETSEGDDEPAAGEAVEELTEKTATPKVAASTEIDSETPASLDEAEPAVPESEDVPRVSDDGSLEGSGEPSASDFVLDLEELTVAPDSADDGERPSEATSEGGDEPSVDAEDASADEGVETTPPDVEPEEATAEPSTVDAGTDTPAEPDDVTPREVPPGYQSSGEPVADDMTCDDCVYVETCPNKDQRQPSSCGSFQWK